MSLPRGAMAWSVIVKFSCASHVLGSGEPSMSFSCVLLSCGCKCYMFLPCGAMAWSVIVTCSCASHVP